VQACSVAASGGYQWLAACGMYTHPGDMALKPINPWIFGLAASWALVNKFFAPHVVETITRAIFANKSANCRNVIYRVILYKILLLLRSKEALENQDFWAAAS
jgi:hypothetical protein